MSQHGGNLSDIVLSDISQTQTNTAWLYLSNEVSKIGKFIESKSRMEVATDWGEGEMGNY